MNEMLTRMIASITRSLSDPWVVFGFVAQSVFFLRFIVQWIASEREKKTVIPKLFWYLSIVGSVLILIYSVYRSDVVFTVASILNIGIYLRNIWLGRNADASV
jgi:lipid-A-disaccharide synthase-like uncharacterized protein